MWNNLAKIVLLIKWILKITKNRYAFKIKPPDLNLLKAFWNEGVKYVKAGYDMKKLSKNITSRT